MVHLEKFLRYWAKAFRRSYFSLKIQFYGQNLELPSSEEPDKQYKVHATPPHTVM